MTYKINQKHLQDLKEGKIALNNDKTNLELLTQILKEAFPKSGIVYGDDTYYFISKYDGRDWMCDGKTNLPTIPLLDFIQEEQFPKDDFGVIVENNNALDILNYLIFKGFDNCRGYTGCLVNKEHYFITKNNNSINSQGIYTPEVSKIYTLSQLKQLDNNNMETTKKIKGYKTPSDLWGGDIKKGVTYIEVNVFNYAPENEVNTEEFYIAKEIVETWEPVYAPTEKVISMGSFNLTVKSEGIFHSSENITQFVESLYKFYSALPSKFVGFDCIVDEITFKKCGCESNKTFAKQWLAVWEEYIKMKQ